MKRRISLLTLVVGDYDEAIAFFTSKLSFSLIADEAQGRKRWVVVAPEGGPGILLARASDAKQETAIGNQTGGRVAFFLETDDFARDHADMLTQGITFLEEPRHESYGIVAQWQDPWGNKWDLLQPA
ncbi:VOC family protein [Algicella marina]|uniref:VOC family protein n=1 Tax=Algicella marina TaxID=2683284 RepID=A0A6P1SU97_9RHOB|nr:VOC family protein [Algicella marina]QHQ34008.1 VOC family protein [Algicella marina]